MKTVAVLFPSAIQLELFISVFNWPLSMESEEYALIFPKWLYPINNISLTLSILLVMLIAHER
jgi:hypothetical protein